MKKFAAFIFITFSVLFLADRGLGFLFDVLYSGMKTGQTGGKINHYLSLSPTPTLLIMGNSRSLYQIIPDSLRINGFNLSHAGMGQSFQTALLCILNDKKKLPKIVLLHLEPYEFTDDHPSRDIQSLKYYYGKNAITTQYLNELSPYEHMKFFFELYRHNGKTVSLIRNYVKTVTEGVTGNGYEMIKATTRDSLNTIYALNKLESYQEAKVSKEQFNKLKTFVDLIKQNNITLICFTSPVFSRDVYYPNTIASLDSLLKGLNIPYINYVEKPIPQLEQNPGLWKDAHHLNHNGAQIESGVLARDINVILKKY